MWRVEIGGQNRRCEVLVVNLRNMVILDHLCCFYKEVIDVVRLKVEYSMSAIWCPR